MNPREIIRFDRMGRPVGCLEWDFGTRASIDFAGFTDERLHGWYQHYARRGTCFHEIRLLREECERRGLSTDPDTLPGQLSLFTA